mmetsp:Transcript_686/g.1159  ORF Transcript_686/g.1159 Transcript_686/m.1159 type:complete len:325 (+) Transcript_686:57-1031(+)
MGRRSKDKRDIYYRKAKEVGFRARSAYKLLQLDEQFNLFGENVSKVVDLCAAPGSWSQVVSKRMAELNKLHLDTTRIVAVDLQEMAPIPGVNIIQGDITKEETIRQIVETFHGVTQKPGHSLDEERDPENSIMFRRQDPDSLADLVISDGAPDVTGVHDIDAYIQSELILAALNVVLKLLREGGSFVAKVFRQKDTDLLYGRLKVFFHQVYIAKPKSSRNSSIEAFVVCKEFKLPEGYIADTCIEYDPTRNKALIDHPSNVNRCLVPFVACGDLSGFDSNMSYDLSSEDELDHEPLMPVQPPINPPYMEAKQKMREKYEQPRNR